MMNRIENPLLQAPSRLRGQSVSEYALIGALVVLVAIPIIFAIGQNATVPLEQINVNKNSDLNDLSSLLSGQSSGLPGGNGSGTGQNPAQSESGTVTIGDENFDFEVDPDGKLVFSQTDPNGNTTSTDGITMLDKAAKHFDELAEAAAASGNVSPQSIAKLRALAQTTRTIRDRQIEASDLLNSSRGADSDSTNAGGIGASAGLSQAAIERLLKITTSGPVINSLSSSVSPYSGGASDKDAMMLQLVSQLTLLGDDQLFAEVPSAKSAAGMVISQTLSNYMVNAQVAMALGPVAFKKNINAIPAWNFAPGFLLDPGNIMAQVTKIKNKVK